MRSALYLLLLTVAMVAVESRSASAQWASEQCTTTELGAWRLRGQTAPATAGSDRTARACSLSFDPASAPLNDARSFVRHLLRQAMRFMQ